MRKRKTAKASEDPLETLLRTTAGADALRDRLAAIGTRTEPVSLDNVTPAAHAFVAALVLRASAERCWIVADGVRKQEHLHQELSTLQCGTLLLPELEMAAVEGALPDPEIAAERLHVLRQFSTMSQGSMLVTRSALETRVPTQDQMQAVSLRLKPGAVHDVAALTEKFSSAGYERTARVAARGEFAVRGGIVDVFSWQHPAPVRIEFFGDTIDSIREFDLDEQISTGVLKEATVLLGDPEEQATQFLHEQIRPEDVVIAVELRTPNAELRTPNVEIRTSDGGLGDSYDAAFFEHGLGEFDAGDLILAEAVRTRFFAQLLDWQRERWTIALFCNNEGEAERFRELLADSPVRSDTILFVPGMMANGFLFPAAKLAVLSDSELFGRYRAPAARRLAQRRTRLAASRSQIDFASLVEGEYVVHLEHGIGIFHGLTTLPGEDGGEVLELEFANESKLFVPVEHSYLVSRYVGLGKKAPPLNSLGGAQWSKARKSAEKAVFDYAANLLTVHARREVAQGFAFEPDGRWQREFEQAFLYSETPDQLRAIADTKEDMESVRPMDRLICGDVGFGKTEVAVRAAFKAVMNGKQVALLVPTTVLAQQHYHHFRERMSDYPIRVEMLSRFRSAAEQRAVIEALQAGDVDIVVGTHRLISEDVIFKNLGLVVVDEEQRFGVKHKDKLKLRFPLVDVLTLSATPIPRTLYMSMMGVRDMSLIETPPANRLPVETIICGYDERTIRDAIQRELARQGQVYFLHNRVHTIERMRDRIRLLCPDARVDIGHGQMHEDDLEEVMGRFVAGDTDVLISTTIIESGLDIPNANTIIIDRADRFGLADLYQLRGRVGRAQHKAYAYFLLPRDMMTAGAARKRIHAIKQYSTLGAGFKIAMRDLEIRGAGNILGTAQSGHIINVGFELYCQLLKQAVARLKGERVEARADLPLHADFVVTTETDAARHPERLPVLLPSAWISDAPSRMEAYRKISSASSLQDLQKLETDWKDRYGDIPSAARNLLLWTEIRILAAAKKIARIDVKEGKLMLTCGKDYVLVEGKFPRLTAPTPDLSLRLLHQFIANF